MNFEQAAIALQKATGWADIYQTKNDEICIRFEQTQDKLISGLQTERQGDFVVYRLGFPGLEEIPLSFLTRNSDTVLLQRTLNGRLHSHKGMPSRVLYATGEHDTIIQTVQDWHWNGILHNLQGPARIIYEGYHCDHLHPTTNFEIRPEHLVQLWNKATLHYYENGVPAPWPRPSKIAIGMGWWLRERTPPFAFVREEGTRSCWFDHADFIYEMSNREDAEFTIRSLYVAKFQEEFENHIVKRTGSGIIQWAAHGEIAGVQTDGASLSKLIRWFNDDMLSRIDPWNNFFPSNQERMILISKIKECGF